MNNQNYAIAHVLSLISEACFLLFIINFQFIIIEFLFTLQNISLVNLA